MLRVRQKRFDMTRIQSSVGLISGIPIQETVDQLMRVAAQPKNLVTNRTRLLESEKLAITQLTSLLVAFRFESNQLGTETLFDAKQVSTSNTAALAATVATGGKPTTGSYLVTPVQTASAQQFLSQTFAKDQAIGAGSFSFGSGGIVDKGISLDELNSGAGFQRGKIRITDRSGATALVDLSFARTVDDVLKTISENASINVTAVAVGDSFRLIDNTGGAGILSVQNVAGGRTATELGLAGINVSAAEATGSDVFSLHANTKLTFLNDANGVQLRSGNDLVISLADESTVAVDLGTATTLGEVLANINAAAPTKVTATISADGNRIELTDLTSGSGTLTVTDVGSGTAATDLGLTAAVSGNTIAGRRLVSGLRNTLVASLRGGAGVGTLGQINITNRNNVASSVDLAGAETLGDVIAAINGQATGVTAAINSARNGIVVTDVSGATASNLIVANGDANNSATALGIAASSATPSVNSGGLNRRQISAATLLSSLHGGQGISVGDFTIVDSAGKLGAVDLNPIDNHARTLGDVIDRINALTTVGVEARINDTGDGILLVDTAGGGGTLAVKEVGNGTTAKDLGLLRTATTKTVNGSPTQVIDSTVQTTITIDAEDTLSDLANTINTLKQGVKASVINDANGQRLSIIVEKTGAANELLFDTTNSPLAFQEVSGARDGLILFGSNSGLGAGALLSSTNDTFTNAIDGITLTVKDGSLSPVTVSVASTSSSLVSQVQEFVDAYNSIRDLLDETTAFDSEELTTGILFGTNKVLRVESELTRLISGRFFGVGSLNSLEAVGLSLNDKGQLEFDQSKLTSTYNNDPEAVKSLFTADTLGVAAKFGAVLNRLAVDKTSTLATRINTLTIRIDNNNERIESMDEQLARQRERLLAEFFRIESVIADLQQGLSALSSLQILAPLTSRSSS